MLITALSETVENRSKVLWWNSPVSPSHIIVYFERLHAESNSIHQLSMEKPEFCTWKEPTQKSLTCLWIQTQHFLAVSQQC